MDIILFFKCSQMTMYFHYMQIIDFDKNPQSAFLHMAYNRDWKIQQLLIIKEI